VCVCVFVYLCEWVLHRVNVSTEVALLTTTIATHHSQPSLSTCRHHNHHYHSPPPQPSLPLTATTTITTTHRHHNHHYHSPPPQPSLPLTATTTITTTHHHHNHHCHSPPPQPYTTPRRCDGSCNAVPSPAPTAPTSYPTVPPTFCTGVNNNRGPWDMVNDSFLCTWDPTNARTDPLQPCPRVLTVNGNGGWNAGDLNRQIRWSSTTSRDIQEMTYCCDDISTCAGFIAPRIAYNLTCSGQSISCPVNAERGELQNHAQELLLVNSFAQALSRAAGPKKIHSLANF
jgi:hypothetical protein